MLDYARRVKRGFPPTGAPIIPEYEGYKRVLGKSGCDVSQGRTDAGVSRLPLYLGFLPVLFLTLLIGSVYLFLHDFPIGKHVYEPPLLLPLLNTVFLFLMSCVVCYVVGRSYLIRGSVTILLLGCGVLTLGTGAFFAGWVIDLAGPNATVTIFNVSALVASVFHGIAAVADSMREHRAVDSRSRRRRLIFGYAGVIVFIFLLTLLAGLGTTPLFFTQSGGPTALRQMVISFTLVFYAGVACYMMSRFIRTKTRFFYWYSLGLGLVALNMAGTLLQPAVGSLTGWTARCAAYVAGIYFLLAVGSTSREARGKGVPLNETMAELFRKSEATISSILAGTTDCHYELDRDGRFTRINDQALTYFGRKREEIIGRFYGEVFPNAKGSVIEEQCEKAVYEGVSVHFEALSVVVPSGWVEVHGYPTDEGGISVFFRDITGRKKTEDALRTNVERLEIISDTAGRLLMSREPQKIVEDVCRRIMEHLDCHVFFNYLVDEGRDRMRLNAYAGIPEETAKDIRFLDFGVAVCGCAARDASRIVAENIPMTPDVRTDLVRSFGIKAYACHPLFAQGSVIGTLSFGTRSRLTFSKEELFLMKTVADQVATAMERIRLLRFAEERAEELESRVEERTGELKKQAELLNLAHDAIIVRDAQGCITFWNTGAETIYGWKRNEAIGKTTNDLLKTKYPVPLQEITDIVHNEKRWEGELVHTGKDGKQIVVLSRWSLRGSEAGASEEILEINHDITDRKMAEERLRQAQKMEAIGTLAGGVAHDFNNILGAVLGFTEMAIEDTEDRPFVQKSLNNVLKSVLRARELVKQILAFSRKTSYERSPLSVILIVKETVQLLRASIPATIEIALNITATSDTILASPVEIQQILMNLVTNASIAMQEKGGTLRIDLGDIDFKSDPSMLGFDIKSGEYVQFSVKDAGAGMSPDIMKRVFEPFFTTREVGKGTGMGLAVVYGIVKDLQGAITVESELGVGSTFRVFLPKLQSEVKARAVGPLESPGGNERILFVDDEEMLVEWGQTTLERLGYQVTTVTDSEKALKTFSADPNGFDLVITDHAMPRMAGVHLAAKILEIRRNMPVILCTGHSEGLTPEKVEEIGIRELLMKPLARQELALAIRRILDMGMPT